MSFLVVGGVTVPVVYPDGAENEVEEIGDMERAFAGNMLSSIRARKNTWPVQTRPLTSSERTALRAALVGTPPIACSGDLLGGSVNCVAVLQSDNVVSVAAGRRYILAFELHEI